jgi:hypothetical protein
VCVQEPCVYLLSAASVVIRNNNTCHRKIHISNIFVLHWKTWTDISTELLKTWKCCQDRRFFNIWKTAYFSLRCASLQPSSVTSWYRIATRFRTCKVWTKLRGARLLTQQKPITVYHLPTKKKKLPFSVYY